MREEEGRGGEREERRERERKGGEVGRDGERRERWEERGRERRNKLEQRLYFSESTINSSCQFYFLWAESHDTYTQQSCQRLLALIF